MDSHGRHLWGDRVDVLGQKTHEMCSMPVVAVLYLSSWPVPIDSLKRLILNRHSKSIRQKGHQWSKLVKIFATSLKRLIIHLHQRKTSEIIAFSNLKNWGMAVTLSPWLSCPTSQSTWLRWRSEIASCSAHSTKRNALKTLSTRTMTQRTVTFTKTKIT